jgi:hypothetical protein
MCGKLLASSIKGDVKKKHISSGWNFSCFAAGRERSVLTCRAMCSVAGHLGPSGLVFSTSGFHRESLRASHARRRCSSVRAVQWKRVGVKTSLLGTNRVMAGVAANDLRDIHFQEPWLPYTLPSGRISVPALSYYQRDGMGYLFCLYRFTIGFVG